MLIIFDSDKNEYMLHRADRRNPEAGALPQPINANLTRQMLVLPSTYAIVYNREMKGWKRWDKNFYIYDVEKGERLHEDPGAAHALVTLFDAEALVTVPVNYHNKVIGRTYLTSQKSLDFDHSDADFLLQLFKQVMPLLDNIRLVDRLASDAAEEERRRIAGNIHDSVIQPYLGLQLGLTGVRERLSSSIADPDRSKQEIIETVAGAVSRIEHLIEMTNMGVAELRRYISGLKDEGEPVESLPTSVRRFAAKFTRATGIDVQIIAEGKIIINDRLAAEAFQIIAEGLSNVRRHTQARRALIKMSCLNDQLILSIENDNAGGAAIKPFILRSIAGHVEALGGRMRIEGLDDVATAVIIEIPL